MSQIKLDLPRRAGLPRGTIAMQAAVAGLAAVGLISLFPPSGGRDQAMLVLPMLAALLALGTLVGTRNTVDRARREAGSATITDPETGLATAVAGKHMLEREFSAAQRGRTLTIALIRVDEMAGYRVQHGDVVADQLLRKVGRILARNRRGMHVAAHYPGEPGTYLAVLSGVGPDGAATYATRVRRELLRTTGLPRPAGVSVGVAAFDMSMESSRDLVRRASLAMRKGAAVGGKVVVVGGSNDSEAA